MQLRMDLICTDGTCISIPNISSVREDIDVYIEECRNYRTLITVDKEIEDADNLWDWKYRILNKRIKQIQVYGSTMDESGTVTESLIEDWENVGYSFHGIYRTISFVSGIPSNIIHLILSTDMKSDIEKE